MSADPTPAPDFPTSETKLPAPTQTPETPPAPDLPSAANGLPPKTTEPARSSGVQTVPVDAEPAGLSTEARIAALRVQLQALLSQEAATPPLELPALLPDSAVTSKNRRFTAKPSTWVVARAPASATVDTNGQTSDPAASSAQPASGRVPEAAPILLALPKSETPDPARMEVLASKGRFVEEAFSAQRRQRQRNKRLQRLRNVALGALALVVLSLALGRLSAPSRHLPSANVPAATNPTPISPIPGGARSLPWRAATLARLDEILAHDRAGKLDGAFQEATALRKERGPLPGLDLYLGNLNARAQRYEDANNIVTPLAEPDIPPALAAVACDQLGFVASRQRSFVQAATYFSQAVANDPFHGEYYYHWAEALRRQGRQGEARTAFQQALSRLQAGMESETLRECAALKMRLSSIELGQEAQFKNELDAQLKAPAPSGYWLLTAAALALQEKRVPAAVDALQQAKAVLPPPLFDELASDYFFRAFANQSELAACLPAHDASQEEARRRSGVYFIDP